MPVTCAPAAAIDVLSKALSLLRSVDAVQKFRIGSLLRIALLVSWKSVWNLSFRRLFWRLAAELNKGLADTANLC